MNWIIPKKVIPNNILINIKLQILALSSPTEKRVDGLPPHTFIDKFKKMKIKAIVRLNERLYDETPFIKADIKVYELEFQDGSSPEDVHNLTLF